MASFMIRIYPGELQPATVFLPVRVDERTTAAHVAKAAAAQLGIFGLNNLTLVEQGPDNSESVMEPDDLPMERFLLWPSQAKSAKYTANKYKFTLRQAESRLNPRQVLESKGFLPSADSTPQDLCNISSPSPSSLLRVLRKRFESQEIYTWAGPVLVSLNPYCQIANLYGPRLQHLHRGRGLQTKAHVFAVADAAFETINKGKHSSCSIVVSGESGSGKSFCTEILVQHLLTLVRSHETRIVAAVPILENFGHAKTRRNVNSSRVGKFMTLSFAAAGRLTGAKLEQYLLEVPRIIQRHPQERNFHIFYTLLYGLAPAEKERVGLRSPDDYAFIRNSNALPVEEREETDGRGIIKLQNALDSIALFDSSQYRIFQIMAGILALGNIDFKSDYRDQASIVNTEWLEEAAHLLSIKPKSLLSLLTEKSSKIGRGAHIETLTRKHNCAKAYEARDGLAKAAYRKVFDFLLLTLNAANRPEQTYHLQTARNIGILDIFGFEQAEEGNSFEQFCINYANETLQLFSNQHIFELEKEEHEKEDLRWTDVQFSDNEAIIELYSRRPEGLFCLLNENIPGLNDIVLLNRFDENNMELKPVYRRNEMVDAFAINHYAGWVEYNIEGFVEKNRDVVATTSLQILRGSSCWLLRCASAQSQRAFWRWRKLHRVIQACSAFRKCFDGGLPELNSSIDGEDMEEVVLGKISRAERMKKIHSVRSMLVPALEQTHKSQSRTTTSLQYQQSLAGLMDSLRNSMPFFVKCVRTNARQEALTFDDTLILEQLKSSGMTETVKIKQSAYPVRLEHMRFLRQYGALLSNRITPSRAQLAEAVDSLGLANSTLVGKTQIFMKDAAKADLDKKLEFAVINKVRVIQRAVREWIKQPKPLVQNSRLQEELKRHAAAIVIQKHWRGFCAREQCELRLFAAVTIQQWWRACMKRDRYLRLQEFITSLQAVARRYLAKQKLAQLKIARAKVEIHKRLKIEHDAAIVIQQWWRRTWRLKEVQDGYKLWLDSAKVIQRWWRRKRAERNERESQLFDGNEERFKTMKLMSPVANLDPIDQLNVAFVEMDSSSSQMSQLEPNESAINYTPEQTDVVTSPRRRRQSPEQKWIVPDQTVALKPVFPAVSSTPLSKPVRPPSNGSNQPYQVQLVRKETLRSQLHATQHGRSKTSWSEMEQMEMIPTPDLNFSGDVSELGSPSSPPPQSKKSSRRHKREQESMMMNAQLPPKDPSSKESEAPKMRNSRRPRSRSSQNRRQSEADLPDQILFEKKVRPRERPPSAILPRDKIHERIELRPDGSRTSASFVLTPRSYEQSERVKSQFRPSPQPLERRDSIRERREVPPPAKIIQRRAPVERHQSVKEKIDRSGDRENLEIDPALIHSRQVPHSTRLLRKSHTKASSSSSRNRSNSLDAQERLETTTTTENINSRIFKKGKSDWQAEIPDWENNDKLVVDGKLAPLNMPVNNRPSQFSKTEIKPMEPSYQSIQPIPETSSSSSSKRSSNIVHVFKNRLKRKRNKQKEAPATSNLSVIPRKEVIPRVIVLDESDPEGPENLIAFLDERVKSFNSTLEKDDSGNDEMTLVNDIWRNALNEFKDTLRSLSVQGYNELLLDQLLENFSEAFQSQIHRSCAGDEEKKRTLPYQMFMNSFRGTLEDFVKENKSLRPIRRPRPKKIEKEDCRGHHFSRHQVIQPNVCAVCQQRLFFMIDKVQLCSICKILVHKDCIKSPKLPQCSLTSQDLKLFGVPLQCLCKDGQDTPEFVIKVLSYLELNGILKQGIYRVSGAKVEEKKLESELEQDPYCRKVRFESYNVHCVASIFKIFLRKLPDPLVPFEYYDNVLRAMTLSEKECSDELLSIFNGLPRHHRGTLERVVFHLARVAQKSEDNKMNPQNLAIIIAPCIIRAPDHIPPLTVAQQIGATTRAVEIIIRNQLEVLKTKFNSFSALDAKERQLQRGLKEVRRSKMKHSIRVSRHQSKAPVAQNEPEESMEHDEKRLAADLARIKQQKRATFSSIRAFSHPNQENMGDSAPPRSSESLKADSVSRNNAPSTPKADQFIRADKNRLAHRRFNKSSKYTNL